MRPSLEEVNIVKLMTLNTLNEEAVIWKYEF